MRALLNAVCIISLIASPTSAFAEKCVQAQALSTPCEGVLLPTSAASEGLRCLEVDLPKLKLEKEHEAALALIRENKLNAMVELERSRADEYRKLLDKAIEVKAPPADPWYKHPALWVTIGVVVGAGASIGITYAVNQR